MIKSPCKDCPEIGCGSKHDSCEKYLLFKLQGARLKEANEKSVEINRDHLARIINVKKKVYRGGR